MADAGNIYAYNSCGCCMGLLKTLKSEDIGKDICYAVPDYNNREVEYILYTDKCGCSCCLPLEDELIIHQYNGEIKDISLSGMDGNLNTSWCEIYGNNWCKTVVRYKFGDYPESLTDGILLVEETQKNQYSSNPYSASGLESGCTYYLRYFGVDNNGEEINSFCDSIYIRRFETLCFGYTGAEQCVELNPGTYKLEVWGAQGGNNGGKGGYSSGCICLSSSTTLYIYVGQCGYNSADSAFNGGGRGSCTGGGGGGGGGTDIRIGGNTLYHRRIVAGGGGGHDTSWVCYAGGVGGGCNGGNVSNGKSSSAAGQGGTQTVGGSYINNGATATGSGFGVGGYGNCPDSSSYAVTGGGGGWYGGGGGQANSGGGGSGYVYNSSTCGNTPSGYCHCTDYFLTNACTCCGAVSFPSPSGGTETGHCGCGCVIISMP